MINLNSNSKNFQSQKLTKDELRKVTGGLMPPGDVDGTGNQDGFWNWLKDLF